MRYPDAMVFSRTLFTELLAQRKNEFGNYERLMEPASSSFWSEHSERVTIISWASACGVEKETRKRWGRWSPTVDEDYVTTTRQLNLCSTEEDGCLHPGAVRGEGCRRRPGHPQYLHPVASGSPSQDSVGGQYEEARRLAPPGWGQSAVGERRGGGDPIDSAAVGGLAHGALLGGGAGGWAHGQ